jgi:6-phosphofructokinase 1
MNSDASSDVAHIGQCRFRSPLAARHRLPLDSDYFVADAARVHYVVELDTSVDSPDDRDLLSFEKAGPRSKVYFDPDETTVAMVTCGGLCPGLNNVIRSVFLELQHNYGLRKVLGIRNGYLGLNPDAGLEPRRLTHDDVEETHHVGGTLLGSSRGPQDPEMMADFLARRKIDILFCLGGDGTQRGAHALHQAITARRLPIAVVGIPKTIDNDIPFVWQSFGYDTALEKPSSVSPGSPTGGGRGRGGGALGSGSRRGAGPPRPP